MLVVLGVMVMLGLAGLSLAQGLLAWDVRFAYLPAADAVLHGHTPYPMLHDPILDEQKGYVYPPQLLFVLIPLTVLPTPVVAAIVGAGMIALLLLTLRVLEVQDVRCYAAALLWVPAISAVLLSNLSIPLAFALALMWRYRNAVWPSAVALGLSVSAKLLLWPMFVWVLATRRLKTFALAVVVGVGVTFAAWAAIGFDGLSTYPDLLRRLSDLQSHRSYSFVGMASTAGLPEAVGSVLALVLGGALLVGCVVYARRGDEPRAFTCAVVATLALSPVVWLHYLVALLVPTAILRPRFSAIWLLPVLLWVSPKPGYAGGPAIFAPGIVAAIMVAALLLDRGGRKRAPATA
jgi:hypothetical protein